MTGAINPGSSTTPASGPDNRRWPKGWIMERGQLGVHALENHARPVPVASPSTAVLTVSELEVLEDAANGLTIAETARRRFKGRQTVKTQRRSILLKLGARNISQAVAIVTRNRLIAATDTRAQAARG
jgi:DNA-binding CsgD family transcriptional regulator